MGAVKLLAVSTVGVVWAAMMCRLVGPAAYLSLADWLPRVYVAMASWLTPPYLYLIINGIILSIAASSRFSPPKSVPVVKDSVPVPVPVQDSVQVPVPGPVPVSVPVSVPLPDPVSVEVPNPVPVQVPVPTLVLVPVPSQAQKPIFEISDLDEEEDFVIRGPRWGTEDTKEEEVVVAVPSPPVYNVDVSLVDPVVRTDATEMSNEYARMTESAERPPVSARFGRKGVRPSPEGKKALRVVKSRKGETLESTWRAITEGRAMPLTRHLKKSDTWETRVPRNGTDEVVPPPGAAMRKAETFHERGGGVESPVLGSGERKIKREPSLGQDDLNRRVEAFIKKFNEEMRMQRQESFKHYMDMINRGADQ